MTPVVESLQFHQDGLIPAIAQDAQSREVLMLAYMNREALEQTLLTGEVHYWSRQRKKLWKKGESSGHVQRVHRIFVDCDQDCVLIEVHQQGAACHEGYRSCFFRQMDPKRRSLTIVGQPVFDPAKVYRGRAGQEGAVE